MATKSFRRRRMLVNRRECRVQVYGIVGILLFLVHGGGTCGPGQKNLERKSFKQSMLREEQIPDVQEMSAGASGHATGRVKRGSKRFNDLVTNHLPNIIFNDDDESGDTRRMTKRCSQKLSTLSAAVSKEWGGTVKLRVLRSYEDGQEKRRIRKDPTTLHYEGRAVDIQTSDLDRRKYPKLGRLAVDAGFDWVKYSSRNHIHASVKATDVEHRGCFHPNSSVQLLNKKTILMKDLKIGDRVASLDDQGKIVYSPVIMFFHRSPRTTSTFLSVNTLNNEKELLITPTHLIYKLNKQAQQGRVDYAKRLAVGDHLYIRNTSNPNSVTTQPITSVSARELTGVIAPLTDAGNIIVDDIVVSCYAAFPSDTISHWTMLPVRVLARICPNFFETDEEIPWYPRVLFKLYSIVQLWMGHL